jgi:hypothetical protein
VDPQSRLPGQGRERDGGGMAVLVIGPDRYQCGGGAGELKEACRRPGARSVVTDLEHVDRVQQPTLRQACLDGSLRVTGQQGDESTGAQDGHDRPVVDIAVGQRPGRIGGRRIDDFEGGRLVDWQPQARATQYKAQAGLVACIGQEAGKGGVVERNPGMDEHSHPEPCHHLDQARDVILVRMGEQHQIDAALEERQVRSQPSQGEVRVRAAVDQHGASGR